MLSLLFASCTVSIAQQSRADELMYNFADNVAAAELAVERCGAEYTRVSRIAKEAADKHVRALVKIARGRFLADVKTALQLMGREGDGELGETVILCRMISETYAGPNGVVSFPVGSMWRR